MKRQVLAVVMAGGLLGCCVADEPAPPAAVASGVPKIQFDKTVCDFGTTSKVSKLEGVVVVSNVGDAPLEKLKAQAHCGCTTTGFKVDKLAPGEKTELVFSLAVNAMNRGPISKQITITSSDPKQPSVNLTLKADLISLYEFKPQSIVVGDLHTGSSTNFAIEIIRTDGKPIGISKVEGAGPLVRPKLEATEGVTTTGTIRVEVVAEGGPRNFGDAVRVYGASATEPLMIIQVGGRIVGDLALSVDRIFWGVTDSANWPGPRGVIATTRKIVVTANSANEKLEPTNIQCSIPELQVSVKPVTEGKQYEIEAVLEKLPKESTPGTIKFDTNLKSQPTVEIKVQINILKRS